MYLSNFKYLLLIFFALTACQSAGGATVVAPTASPRPTISPTEEAVGDGGQLAYIGGDGNLYVTTPDRSTPITVTNDASAPWEGQGLSYQRLAWSPEGWLAYAAVTRSGDDATSKLYVVTAPGQPAQLVGQSGEHFVIYIYWSPVPCPNRPNCRQLAYLIEEREGIALRLVQIEDGRVKNQIIGSGWPYYFSWAADGESILWHTGGTGQENNGAVLAWYDLPAEAVQTLPHAPANFMAPAWSPQGDRWLGALAHHDEGRQLQLLGPNKSQTVANIPTGGVSFAWSPQGDRVAYALKQSSDHNFYGPIHIFDPQSEQSAQITDQGLRVVAFFWDPAGERLGYLTKLFMPTAEWMQWRVYDLVDKRDRGFKVFNPSLQMDFVMSSFNQYAQSHRFWSPDGRYLVYANRDDVSREERVWLIDTRSEDGHNAQLVDEGTMGFWSWQ